MKNIIIIKIVIYSLFLSSCKKELKTTDKINQNTNIENLDKGVNISIDTIGVDVIYVLTINNGLCVKNDTILKHTIDE